MFIWTFILSSIALLVANYIIDEKKKSRLDSRDILSDDEIYQKFYAASGFDKASVLEIWHEIADTLSERAECMRPSDRFGEDIGTSSSCIGMNLDIDALVVVALDRMKRQGVKIDLESIRTVDDYVRCFALQLSK